MFAPYNKQQSIQFLSDIYADHRNILSIYPEPLSTTPLLVASSKMDELNDFYRVFIKIIHEIVKNYLHDPDINTTISFNDEKIVRLLSYLEKYKPYRIGALRPDFLIDQSGAVKLCEINGRFITNGILISEYLSGYYSEHFGLMPASSGMLNEYCEAFDQSKNICILKGKEHGRDIFFLEQELKSRMCGARVIMAEPQQLNCMKSELIISGEKYTQFILELHQSELMSLDYSVLKSLFMANTINDFRTIMIVHDKRIFTLLSDRAFLEKYLAVKDVVLLMKYIPKTLLFKNIDEKTFLKKPEHWVLKKSNSGKGDGMYICDGMTNIQIKTMLNQSLENYVVQEYILQRKHPASFSPDGVPITLPVHYVGALTSFNDTYHGMVIVRGGTQQNISVAHGATIFIPLID